MAAEKISEKETTLNTNAMTLTFRADQPTQIGARIKAARAELRITQAELARRISMKRKDGCTRASVGQWEINATFPSYQMMVYIADALKLTPGYLAFGDVYANGQSADPKPVDIEGLDLLAEIRIGNSPDDRRKVRVWGIPSDLLSNTFIGGVEALFIVEVRGSALQPLYDQGDRVYVDSSDTRPDGSPFLFWDGAGASFGILTTQPTVDGPMIKISGDGVDFPLLPLTAIKVIGKVKGRMRLG